MNKKLKLVLVILAIVLSLLVIFYFLGNRQQPKKTSLVSTNTDGGPISSANSITNDDTAFLSTLDYLKSIQIDASIFISSSFKSLEDNTVTIDSNRFVGRSNPFSPIPGSQQIPLVTETSNENSGSDTNS